MTNLDQYCFELPKSLIAKFPAVPRDHSRLFVYDTSVDKISFDCFLHIEDYLPEKSLLIFNDTKVLPSRIVLRKESGGKVIALILVNETVENKEGLIVKALVDRKIEVGDRLSIDSGHKFFVAQREEKIFTLKAFFSKPILFSILEKRGRMPIPLYLKDSPLRESQLKRKYQTIFAQNKGSSAAPTASLHFTSRIFNRLEKKGIQKAFVTLHVGMGTFAPLTIEQMNRNQLHEEYFQIPENSAEKIQALREKNFKIVAVGTTVARALESASEQSGALNSEISKTQLFIHPPYSFKIVNSLLTNFHLPASSLIMLVDGFLKHKNAKRGVMDLYKIAIQEKFRFYSFGDAMLIL